MHPHDLIRIRHMFEAANDALTFAKGRQRSELDRDRQLLLSIVKSIEIIGEAASKVSTSAQEKHSDIPWHAIITMRHRLVHGYFDIDHEVVWQTLLLDLPPLLGQLEAIMQQSGNQE
jgi:uncharacterized protein with HEPN domain